MLGSDAHGKLWEEAKQYWDKGNLILKGKSAWMAKNLEVGKKAIYKDRKSGTTKNIKLDSPERGGNKKFIVYRNSGRTDKETGEIVAKKIEWGDPKLSVKNDDPGASASFWARHGCDKKEKINHKCQLKDNQKNGYCLVYNNEKLVAASKYKAGKKLKEWTTFASFKRENNLSDLQ